MRCALILFGLAVLAPACSTRVPVSPAARARARSQPAPARTASPRPAPAAVTSCRAAPATIYGEEPVVFEIEGSPSASPVDVELIDPKGRALAKARAPVPGAWRPTAVPSGDFRLQFGSNAVSCSVTVNRELSRATQPTR